MANVNNEVLDDFRNIINNIIKEQFEIFISKANIEFFYDGVVTAISGTNAKVDLGFQITEFIPNRTGETLNVGNKVRVYSGKSTLVGAFIGVQLDTYTP